MKQTQKYSKATQILKFPHQTQEELYLELNRLGWYWQPKTKEWKRDDTPAKEPTTLIKVRVWADTRKVKQAAELFIENAETMGLILVEKTHPYQCRPPLQKESIIYLLFQEDPEED